MKRVILTFLLLLPFCPAFAEEDCGNVYVWSVSQKEDYIDESLLYNITNQIETALISNSDCRILERRKYSDLEQHSNNEQQILSFEQIPESSYKDLTIIEAQRVVLGEVLKDEYNGNPTYTLSLSITDLATKVIIAKSETYFTPVDLLQPNERLKKINALIKSMLSSPPKRQNTPDNNQLAPDNPRVKLRTMGVDWSVKNFAEALYSGDMQVAELFFSGGMSPIARYNDASVVLYGFTSGAINPNEVLDLLEKYAFDFNSNLFDGSIMKSRDEFNLLPFQYNFDSYFKPPRGYSSRDQTFEGPLLLWLYQINACFGSSQEDIDLLLKVKEHTGYSEQVYTFINQHWPWSGSEIKVKKLFAKDLVQYNNAREKPNNINISNIEEYKAYWSPTISVNSNVYDSEKNEIINKDDGLTVLNIERDKLWVRKVYNKTDRVFSGIYNKEIDTRIYEAGIEQTNLLSPIVYYNYINDFDNPKIYKELRHKVSKVGEVKAPLEDNEKLFFILTVRVSCGQCNTAFDSIKDFIKDNIDKYQPILMPGDPTEEGLEQFIAQHNLTEDWFAIKYYYLDDLYYLNSIIIPEKPNSTLLPHLTVVDKYGLIKLQKFNFKTLDLAWFEEIDK